MSKCAKHGTEMVPTPNSAYRYHCEKCVQEETGFPPMTTEQKMRELALGIVRQHVTRHYRSQDRDPYPVSYFADELVEELTEEFTRISSIAREEALEEAAKKVEELADFKPLYTAAVIRSLSQLRGGEVAAQTALGLKEVITQKLKPLSDHLHSHVFPGDFDGLGPETRCLTCGAPGPSSPKRSA